MTIAALLIALGGPPALAIVGSRTFGESPSVAVQLLGQLILYRGYAVERLASLTGREWVAGGVAAIAFGLAHIPFWGVGPALTADFLFGVVMTLFYLWRRDLLANIGAHATLLMVGMFTLPAPPG